LALDIRSRAPGCGRSGPPSGRRERPHPVRSCAFRRRRAAADRVRHQHPPGEPGRHLADLNLRHRRRSRAEDRIRLAKNTGLRDLRMHGLDQNRIWCARRARGRDHRLVVADARARRAPRPPVGAPTPTPTAVLDRRPAGPHRPRRPFPAGLRSRCWARWRACSGQFAYRGGGLGAPSATLILLDPLVAVVLGVAVLHEQLRLAPTLIALGPAGLVAPGAVSDARAGAPYRPARRRDPQPATRVDGWQRRGWGRPGPAW
jgi:hypothetical protein